MSVIEFNAYRPEVIASGRKRSAALKVIVDRLMALRQFSTPYVAEYTSGDELVHNGLRLDFYDDRGHTYMSVAPIGEARRVFTAWLQGPGKVHVMCWKRGWEKSLF